MAADLTQQEQEDNALTRTEGDSRSRQFVGYSNCFSQCHITGAQYLTPKRERRSLFWLMFSIQNWLASYQKDLIGASVWLKLLCSSKVIPPVTIDLSDQVLPA